ncbi:OmpW family protein [Duganella sp. LX20W]|uniref:OmpW family protein n=1 Tax=Rugamonas brunnea TaxID=2758569 RepID=A0A7W2IDA3_9BURK|nr:OmpW family protein [Rugamonas brunnea]MBA5639194.1 OmpW family protein [Rugamonas brunnea]
MNKSSIWALALLAGPATAHADDMPANQLRAGIYAVSYASHADDVTGPFTPPGVNLAVQSVRTPYLAYARRLAPHWELELAAGVPPTTRTVGRGPAKLGSVPFDGQLVATAKWCSPTLLLHYRFGAEDDALRPAIGLGVNATWFYERSSTPAGDAVNGGPTRISLSRSVGPAATAGLSYRLTPELSVIASYSRVRVNSHYQSDTAGIARATTIRFNPSAWVLALGYAF